MEAILGLLLFVGCLMIYLFPAFVASKRRHRNVGAIALLNLLLGWTFLGWVVSLVWAATSNVEAPQAEVL